VKEVNSSIEELCDISSFVESKDVSHLKEEEEEGAENSEGDDEGEPQLTEEESEVIS
jgi:hypothetical protein